MGEGATSKFGWGLRLLIMAYGTGIVLIGFYPLQKRHGSVLDYLSRDSIANAREWLSETEKALELQGKTELNLIPEAPVQGVVEQGVVSGKKEEKLDHLTKDDRTKLNKLIEGL